MALYALDDLDDALAATRNFLTPVERGVWLRLALVAFFVGGVGTNATGWFGGNGGGTPGEMPDVVLEPWVWLVVGAVVIGALVLGLAFLLVGSIMEFVFVESLRNESVTVRRYWGRRWRQGVRLFGFRILLGLTVLLAFLTVAVPLFLPLIGMGSFGPASALFLLFVPLLVLLAIVAALVHTFTTVFVVPVMILRDCGVLAGWRVLWPTITAHWRQYLAYAVAGFFLSILGGVAVGVATVVAVLLLFLPFALLFALAFGLFVVVPPAGIVAFVVLGILAVLTVIVVVALAQVPVKTYLRYYALFVLGDVEPDLDLVQDQRTAIRSESNTAPGGDGGEPT